LACLTVAAVSCTPAARPAATSPAPAAPPAARAVPEIPWAADRPLTWTDFRGTPPTDGAEQARTVYQLSYESRCRGFEFTVHAAAVMLPLQSWVKPGVLETPAGSARVLRHEQTHFNLTEVYARRMRRFFKELYNPCGLLDERLREAVDRFGTEEAEAQKRYDSETKYGLEAQVQDRWDREVAAMLADLEAYASTSSGAGVPNENPAR
jgi:hypothetical protein